jgi:TonB-linked SusC/RagA family outer membrane protein
MKNIFTALLLILVPMFLLAQESGTISGKVIDESGAPLVGTNVTVVNTTLGAAADIDGKFSIAVPPGIYSVRASHIGYEPKVIENVIVRSGQKTEISFRLTATVIKEEEVVVLGYGVQKKREVSGAVASVNVSALEKIPTANVSTALQGITAGVDVVTPVATPGAEPSIMIRGTGTLNVNTPLYVIDGVPTTTLFYLNPRDIESIDILKDASAAAIYGSRAANGVVLITTVRGRKGVPLRLTINSYYNTQTFSHFEPLVTNSADYIRLVKEACQNAGVDFPKFVTDYEKNPSAYPNTDWQKAFFHNAPMQKYDLAIDGGGEKWNFAVSGYYSRQDGIQINTNQENRGLRLNSDFQLSDRFKVGESCSLGETSGQGVAFENSVSYELFRMPPTVPVLDPTNQPSGWGNASTGDGYARIHNPVAEANLRKPTNESLDILASGYLEYTFISTLKYRLQASQQYRNSYNYYWVPSFYVASTWMQLNASLSETRSERTQTVVENLLTYDLQLNDHSINALAGYTEERADYRDLYGYAENFPSNDIKVLGAGTASKDVSSSASSARLRSLFGRLSYSYAEKYLFQANVRRDGSSRFAEEHRYGVFPSVSAGWRISKEPFFKVPYVTDLKLRGSYGVLGNQGIGDYQYLAPVSRDAIDLNYPLGPGPNQPVIVGAIPDQIPAYGIKWEQTASRNLGFDLSMLNDNLSLTVDYYTKKTSGILYAFHIPSSVGAPNNPLKNVGEMENKGWEFTAGYRDFEGDLKYQVTGNLTTYKNKLLSLGTGVQDVILDGNIHWSVNRWTTMSKPGLPLGEFFLFRTNGIFQSDQEAASYVNSTGARLQPDAKAGDIRFVDENSDGVIDDKDRVDMGNGTPKFEYSLNFNARYTDWDVSLFFVGAAGKKMYNGNRVLMNLLAEFGNFDRAMLNAWTPQNTNTNIPRVVLGDLNENSRPSDRWLEDASFLRLRHIELGYTVPFSTVSSYGIARIRIYVAADNLFTITKYTGYDPATDGSYSIFRRGVDINSYPFARSYTSGIQLVF